MIVQIFNERTSRAPTGLLELTLGGPCWVRLSPFMAQIVANQWPGAVQEITSWLIHFTIVTNNVAWASTAERDVGLDHNEPTMVWEKEL